MRFLSRSLSTLVLFFALAILILPITRIVRSDSADQTAAAPTESAARPRVDYTQLPLSFEANTGRSGGRVRFMTRNGGYDLFLTQTEAVLSITPHQRARSTKGKTVQPSVIRIELEGQTDGLSSKGSTGSKRRATT